MSFPTAARKVKFRGGRSLEAFQGELSRRRNIPLLGTTQLQRDLLDRCCCSRVNSAHLIARKESCPQGVKSLCPGRVWFRLKPVQVTRACSAFSFRDAFKRSSEKKTEKKDKRVTAEVAAGALQSFIPLIRRTHAEDDTRSGRSESGGSVQILGNTFLAGGACCFGEETHSDGGAEMRNGPNGILNAQRHERNGLLVLSLPAEPPRIAQRKRTM